MTPSPPVAEHCSTRNITISEITRRIAIIVTNIFTVPLAFGCQVSRSFYYFAKIDLFRVT